MVNIEQFKEKVKQQKKDVFTITTINKVPKSIVYCYFDIDEDEEEYGVFPFTVEITRDWKYEDIDAFTEDNIYCKWHVSEVVLTLPDEADSIEVFEIDTLEKRKDFLKALIKTSELYDMYSESKKVVENQKGEK